MAEEEADATELAKEIDTEAATVPAHALIYWDAFARLSPGRPVVNEMSTIPGNNGTPLMLPMTRELPIPWSDLDRYAKRYGIDGRDFEVFERLLVALDDEYLTVAAERRKHRTNVSDEG